jgi:hypothetical protein
VADAEYHLIVAHEVINTGHDRDQLSNMATQAREAMGTKRIEVVAARGYYSGPEILACEEAGITTYVPRTMTSNSKAAGRFSKLDFVYIAKDDEYRCPAGKRLVLHHSTVENEMKINVYYTSGCQTCALKGQHDGYGAACASMGARGCPRMGSAHFLTKTLAKVRTEMSLHVLVYNLKRVMQILGIAGTITAIRMAGP